VVSDTLLINPAQFRAVGPRFGKLRRYSQMVFEISYIDPHSAQLTDLADTFPPEISDVAITAPGAQAKQTAAVAQFVKISANVSDGPNGSVNVRTAYNIDGKNWQTASLDYDATTQRFQTVIPAPTGNHNIFVVVEARDKAGNVAIYTGKGSLLSYSM